MAVCNCIKYLIVCPCSYSHLPTIVQCISMLLGWAEILVMNTDILTALTSVNEVSVRSYLVLTAAMVRYICLKLCNRVKPSLRGPGHLWTVFLCALVNVIQCKYNDVNLETYCCYISYFICSRPTVFVRVNFLHKQHNALNF